jgi:polygalacturonase
VGDDGVALKAGRDQDGWRVAKPTRRVVIRNNRYTGNTGGALAIGSEMSGGVEEVFVENFTMHETRHGLYFKANLDRGGRIRDVHIRDIEMASADTVLIFTNDYHSYRGGNFPTTFEDVTVKNVRCGQAQLGISVVGHPDALVRNVYVEDMTIAAAVTPLRINHVQNLRFANVQINGEQVEAVDKTAPETFEIKTRH